MSSPVAWSPFPTSIPACNVPTRALLAQYTIPVVANGMLAFVEEAGVRRFYFFDDASGAVVDGTNVLSTSRGGASRWLVLSMGSGSAGGGVIYDDLFANRPAIGAVNKGTLFYAGDGHAPFISDGIAWRPVVDTGITGFAPPAAAGFAVVNAGGLASSLTDSVGGLLYAVTNGDGGEDIRVRTVAIPGALWTIEAHFRPNLPPTDFMLAGLCTRASASGNVELFLIRTSFAGNTISRHRATASNPGPAPAFAFSAEVDSYVEFIHNQPGFWMRMIVNAVDRILQASTNGREWMTFYTSLNTDFITADEVGLCLFSSAGGANVLSAFYDSIKLTTP